MRCCIIWACFIIPANPFDIPFPSLSFSPAE